MAKPRPTTRVALLEAGKRLFSRKGLDGITVKELADSAGVNISLVSYHFEGKEGLYRACLRECGQERLQAVQKILQPATSAEDLRFRVTFFIQEMLDYIAANFDQVRILLREIESEGAIPQDLFEDTFLKVFVTMVEFFKSAQKAGLLQKETDPVMLSGLIRGSLSHVARTDFLNKRYFNQSIADPKYREKVTHQIVGIMLDGALSRKRDE